MTVWESVGRVPNRRNVLPHNHSEIPSLGKPFTLSHREGKDRKWAMERKTEKKKRDRVRKGEQTVRQRESDRKPKESDKERERERNREGGIGEERERERGGEIEGEIEREREGKRERGEERAGGEGKRERERGKYREKEGERERERGRERKIIKTSPVSLVTVDTTQPHLRGCQHRQVGAGGVEEAQASGLALTHATFSTCHDPTTHTHTPNIQLDAPRDPSTLTHTHTHQTSN